MKKIISIRPMNRSDLSKVKLIIDENQMFPSEYLEQMTEAYFNQQTDELWFVSENEQAEVIALAYAAPERMTERTWNLLLIAVAKSFQGSGVGSGLMSYVEQQLLDLSARVLLVETSGLPQYKLTRQFYPGIGFRQIAVIPEYYDKGDDKVVFYKSLTK